MTDHMLARCQRVGVRVAFGMGLGIALWMLAMPGVAATGDAGLDWVQMVIQLAGGLSLFLFGMDQMGEALKTVAGDKMRQILGKLTTNRLMGLATGAVVTAIIQSSSVTTVMLVGFVTANLMSLSQAIGVILGADIGTTITAQIVAFPIKKYALLLVAGGFLMTFTSRKDDIRQYGILIMGLGLIFFGMAVMSGAMKPLRNYQPFIDLMQNVSNPLIGILISTAFTALIQSSSATMGIVIVLASQGSDFPRRRHRACARRQHRHLRHGRTGRARQAARSGSGRRRPRHLQDRGGAADCLAHPAVRGPGAQPSRPPASTWRAWTGSLPTPRARWPMPTPCSMSASDSCSCRSQGVFARFCEWVVPDRPITETEEIAARYEPKYLDDVLLDTPALALERTQLEIGRLGERVGDMYEAFLEPTLAHDTDRLEEIAEMDAEVDALHGRIVEYLAQISSGELSRKETDALIRLMQAANQIEHMGDLIETNLVRLGQKLAAGPDHRQLGDRGHHPRLPQEDR